MRQGSCACMQCARDVHACNALTHLQLRKIAGHTGRASGTTSNCTPAATKGLACASALLILLPTVYNVNASLLGANRVAGDLRLVKVLFSPIDGRLSSYFTLV